MPEQLAAATALRAASVAWRKGWGIGLEMSETRGKNRGKHLFETNIYIYICVYIYMVPPPRPTFSTYIQIQTIYIVQLYQVSGMFVESQVSRFKSDKWRLLSFSSLTISPSWIQDPRFPGGLGPGILDPGGLAGSKIQDFAGSWPRNLGSVDPRFPKKSLWASWILACWIQDFPRRVSGYLGSWILACWIQDFPRRVSVLAWWIQDFTRRISGHLGSWILACGIQDFTRRVCGNPGRLGHWGHWIPSLNIRCLVFFDPFPP